MASQDRISQFETMTLADPDNEMGHFSLGTAYADAGRFAEAERSFVRVLELNPSHSKSYELLGRALLELDRREDAVNILKQGFEVAAKSGDVMPRMAIAGILGRLNEPVPDVESSDEGGVVTRSARNESRGSDEGGFHCSRCGRPDGQLEARPFKGELGEMVLASVCSNCWQEWIPMGTKVINELGLALADPKAQDAYDQHMKEFLQLGD